MGVSMATITENPKQAVGRILDAQRQQQVLQAQLQRAQAPQPTMPTREQFTTQPAAQQPAAQFLPPIEVQGQTTRTEAVPYENLRRNIAQYAAQQGMRPEVFAGLDRVLEIAGQQKPIQIDTHISSLFESCIRSPNILFFLFSFFAVDSFYYNERNKSSAVCRPSVVVFYPSIGLRLRCFRSFFAVVVAVGVAAAIGLTLLVQMFAMANAVIIALPPVLLVIVGGGLVVIAMLSGLLSLGILKNSQPADLLR